MTVRLLWILISLLFWQVGLSPNLFASEFQLGVKIFSIPYISNPNSKLISLKGVRLKGVLWDERTIIVEMEKVNRILIHCNVQVSHFSLYQSSFSGTLSNFSDVEQLSASLDEVGFREGIEPVLVFAGSISGYFLYLGGKTGGFSFNEQSVKNLNTGIDSKRLVNIAFALDQAQTNEYLVQRSSDYSPIAHELGHILLNSGHVNFSNLMADKKNLVNGHLTAEQCFALQENPLLNQTID